MADRIESTFFTTWGDELKWVIDDLLYSGSVSEVNGLAPGFELSYDEVEHPWTPIMRSSALVFWEINNAADESLLQQMAQSQEGRFFVRLYINDELEWWGPLVTDLIRIPYASYPYDVQLTARDGLQNLKVNESVVSYATGLDLVIKLLEETDSGLQRSNTDLFLSTAVRWFETNMQYGTGPQRNPFGNWTTSALHAFKKVDEDVWYDHYTVLERCLRLFNAQLKLSAGRWWIIQHTDLVDGRITVHSYNKNFDPNDVVNTIVESGVEYDLRISAGDDPQVAQMHGGITYGYKPQLKKARQIFKVDGRVPIYKRSNLVNIDDEQLAASVVVENNDRSYLRFEAEINTYITSATGNWQTVYIRYTVTIKLVGASTHYYTSSGWQTSPGSTDYQTGAITVPGNTTSTFQRSFFFHTDEIPESGTVFYEVDVSLVSQSGSNVTLTALTIDSVLGRQIAIYHVPEDLTALRDTEITAENSSAGSTVMLEHGDSYMGDGPTYTNNTRVRVSNGTIWLNSSSWRVENSGTARPILFLQLEEILRYYSVPRELFDVEMAGTIKAHQVLNWNGKLYMFTQYKFGGDGIIAGKLLELGRSVTDYDINEKGLDFQPDAAIEPPQSTTYGDVIGLPIGVLRTSASGTTTTLEIPALGLDGPVSGQKVLLQNPVTKAVQEVELAANVQAADTSVTLVEVELSQEFPVGSALLLKPSDAMEMIARRTRGFIASLPLGSGKIGSSTHKVEVDTLTGDVRFDGAKISLPNLPAESEAATGELCITAENVVKLKA